MDKAREFVKWRDRAIYAEHCQEQLLLKVRGLEAKLESERQRARDAAVFAERCFEDLSAPLEWWQEVERSSTAELAQLRAEGRI